MWLIIGWQQRSRHQNCIFISAEVQNATGKALTVNVCKGRYGEVSMTLPNDTLMNEISLGARDSSEVRGGPTASCSDVNNSRNALTISLAPSSFGSVKLCYDDVNQRNIIVEMSQYCPLGYLEQTSSGPCPL